MFFQLFFFFFGKHSFNHCTSEAQSAEVEQWELDGGPQLFGISLQDVVELG